MRRVHGIACYPQAHGDITEWDVSRITDLSYVFCGFTSYQWAIDRGCRGAMQQFNGDLSLWDVSRVTDMTGKPTPVCAIACVGGFASRPLAPLRAPTAMRPCASGACALCALA